MYHKKSIDRKCTRAMMVMARTEEPKEKELALITER
jgi:hypothetical protein